MSAFFAVAAAFFLSGFAALLYETLWVRVIALSCGNTTLAVSAVLAAFMGGLALGSFWGGKAADRSGNNLLFYARLEAGIALYGWLSKPLLEAAGRALLRWGLVHRSPLTQSAVYFLSAALLLAIPATLMGATLPVLTRWAGSAKKAADKPLGLLYGLNTLGAVSGAAAAGFYLIPALGLSRGLLLAGSLNAVCALAARSLSGPSLKAIRAKPGIESASALLTGALLAAGAAGMTCQIAWTRVFAMILGSSTYSFTVILVVFLTGLSLGALTFSGLRRRFEPGETGLSLLFAAISLSVLGGMLVTPRLPYWILRLYPFVSQGGWRIYSAQLALCFAVVFLPTYLMGMVLPWAVAAARPRLADLGAVSGQSYAANTAGAILGCVLAGLVLLPALGAEKALLAAAAAYGLCGASMLFFSAGAREGAALLVVLVLAGALRPAWDPRVISSGMFLYSYFYTKDKDQESFLKDLHRDRVLSHVDGRVSTVSVLEASGGQRYLRVNGKTDASSGGDMDTQLLMGYLPLAMRPRAPQNALVVGFGSGTTAGALATEKALRAIDLVEIEPAVIKAAGFFSLTNRGVLSDPRLRVTFADARQFLASPGPRYDIITSEPSNPWVAGVANLYTAEAFAAVRDRLNPDGVFIQWFHSYRMGEGDFKMIMRTFCAVFPHTALLWSQESDFFLLGSRAPFDIPYPRLKALFEENSAMRTDLIAMGRGLDDPVAFLVGTFLLNDAQVRRMAEGSRIHFDDRPALEFSAPRYLYAGDTQKIISQIFALKNEALPEGTGNFPRTNRVNSLLLNAIGEKFMATGDFEHSEMVFKKALKMDPTNVRSLVDLGYSAEQRGRNADAKRYYLEALAKAPDSAPAHLKLGVLYMLEHRDQLGIPHLEKGLALLPASPEGSLFLAVAYLQQGRAPEALRVLREALSRPVEDPALRENLQTALGMAENP